MDAIANFIIDIINYLIVGVSTVLGWLSYLFPKTPFKATSAPDSVDLGHITYFLPFPTMLLHAAFLCVAILGYYGIRVLARWIKMVKN